MARSGLLTNRSAAQLLTAAAALDFLFVFVVSYFSHDALYNKFIKSMLPNSLPEFVSATFFFLIILYAYWVIAEIILAGRSIGRVSCDLSAHDESGEFASHATMIKRGIGKLSSFGLTGLSPTQATRFDSRHNIVWYSSLAPAKARPIGYWKLIVYVSGRVQAKIPLAQLTSFKTTQQIKIGRDRRWSDIPLPNDTGISGRHCTITHKAGQLYIKDHGSNGQGSANGTIVNKQKIKPNSWYPIKPETVIGLAGVKIRLTDFDAI